MHFLREKGDFLWKPGRRNRVEWWVVRDDDRGGKVFDHGVTHNLVVNASRLWAARLACEHPLSTPLRVMAVGDNSDSSVLSTSPNNSTVIRLDDTKLNKEKARARLPVYGTDLVDGRNIVTSATAILRQYVAAPAGGMVAREMCLYGDIAAIANPAGPPQLTALNSGGALPDSTTYYIVYTWSNAIGETLKTAQANVTTAAATGNDSSIEIIPAALDMPATATIFRSFAGTVSGGPYQLVGQDTNLTDGAEVIMTAAPSGAAPPVANLTLTTGVVDSGAIFNRTFTDPSTVNAGNGIIFEIEIEF